MYYCDKCKRAGYPAVTLYANRLPVAQCDPLCRERGWCGCGKGEDEDVDKIHCKVCQLRGEHEVLKRALGWVFSRPKEGTSIFEGVRQFLKEGYFKNCA